MLQNDIFFKLLMRVRMKLLNLKEVHTYYHQRISNHKKLGSSHIHTSEKLSWLTKSSYFRLIDFTLTYYVRCNHFSQNIIQREMSLNPGGMLKFNNTYLHAYLLFGEVVDFVSRFFIENHRKKDMSTDVCLLSIFSLLVECCPRHEDQLSAMAVLL